MRLRKLKRGGDMGKSAKRKPDLKDEICSVAIKMFSEKGYEATNMTEIADVLGITRTPLYYYFNGKKNLYSYAVKKYLAKKREVYAEFAAEDDDIFTWLRKHIEFACSNISDTVFFNVFGYDEFKALSDLNTETSLYIYALKRRRVLRAVERGELPPGTDVDLFLSNVYVMSYGLIHLINDPILNSEVKTPPGKTETLINMMIGEVKAAYSKPQSIKPDKK
jgi:AcrR family transcriptional regulator